MRRALGIALLMIVALAGPLAAQTVVTVTADTVNLRAQPTTDSAIVATVARGAQLQVLGTNGSWFKVRDARSGKDGYVHSLTVTAGATASQRAAQRAGAPAASSATPPARAPRPAAAPKAPAPPADYSRSFSMILARVGVFLASDSNFKAIYGTGLVFGGELRVGPKRPGGPRIVGWLEATSRQRDGKLSFTKEATKVTVTAVEAGALYRLKAADLSPYVGAGLGYHMLNETNVLGDAKQNKLGFCAIGGVSMTASRRIVLDARLKYSIVSMKPVDVAIKVGGITIGAAIGLKF
jgi:uncharacterized protein YgiM (DUF1202 family)